MNIQEQVQLFYQSGNSDKVYEVDLCEVEPGSYVVNFRYGKRNTNLKEGTKTVFPVDFASAKKIYDKLVNEKKKKGYQENLANFVSGNAVSEEKEDKSTSQEQDSMPTVLLDHLKKIKTNSYVGSWKKSRILFRAAECFLDECTDYLDPFFDSKDPFENYSAIWSLCRFHKKGFHRQVRSVLAANNESFVKNACWWYLLLVPSDNQNSPWQNWKEIPYELKDWSLFLRALNENNLAEIKAAYYKLSAENLPNGNLISYYLYLASRVQGDLRTLSLEVIENLRTTKDFKSIRRIYKLAECLWDTTVLGILGKKLGVKKANYRNAYYNPYTYVDGDYINVNKEKSKPNSKFSFSNRTQNYFNRRLLRQVHFLGHQQNEKYIDLAKSILLSVDEEKDNVKVQKITRWEWNEGYQLVVDVYPKYCTFLAYIYILYGSSERLEINSQRSCYIYKEYLEDEIDIPFESPFIDAWLEHPGDLLDVLSFGKSKEVLLFAVKAVSQNKEILKTLTGIQLKACLKSNFAPLLDLVIEQISQLSKDDLDADMLTALMLCDHQGAQSFAENIFQTNQEEYLQNKVFVKNLLFSGEIKWMQLIFDSFSTENQRTLASKIEISDLLELLEWIDEEYVKTFSNALIKFDGALFDYSYDLEDIKPFLQHSNSLLQFLGAVLFIKSSNIQYQQGLQYVDSFIESRNSLLKSAGLLILSTFPIKDILQKEEYLIKGLFSKEETVRSAVGKLFARIANEDKKYRSKIYNLLSSELLKAEKTEGLHNSVYQILVDSFAEELNSLKKEDIFTLVLSSYEYAQILGFDLFSKKIKIEDLEIPEVVQLAWSDIKTIREGVQDYFDGDVAKIRYYLKESSKIILSKWQDIRFWSFDFFLKHSEPSDWTFEQLMWVCDQPEEDIQGFGRKMVTQVFKEAYGFPLLNALKEHPSGPMLEYTTHYLNKYASSNRNAILALNQYFKTVLYKVNKSAVAKSRICDFLYNEITDPAVAEMAVRLFKPLLSSQSKKDRDRSLQILLKIDAIHPHIDTGIEYVEPKTFTP